MFKIMTFKNEKYIYSTLKKNAKLTIFFKELTKKKKTKAIQTAIKTSSLKNIISFEMNNANSAMR